MLVKRNATLKLLRNGDLIDVKAKTLQDGKLTDVEIQLYGEPRLNLEVGAYTSLHGDPSTSIMLHYQTADGTPVECVYRKEGTSAWIDVPLYADKPFPNSTKRVRWFKLDNLEPNTVYETRLKYHHNIHRFKTFPSSASDVTLALLSDMMNDQDAFRIDAPQGFSIMENNNVDIIAVMGDFVHDNGWNEPAWSLFWREYFKFERSYNLMIPFVVCLGNHDGASYNEQNQRELLWYSNAGSTKDAVTFLYNFFASLSDDGYGVIDISDYFSIIYLNSYHTAPIVGDQTTWLDSVLSERQGRQVFPFFHVPPYPGYYNYGTSYIQEVRQYWTPLFTQYGIKLVGVGHDHLNLVTKNVTGESLDPNGAVYTIHHGLGNNTRGINIPTDQWYVDYIDIDHKAIDIVTFQTDGDVDFRKVELTTGTPLYSRVL